MAKLDSIADVLTKLLIYGAGLCLGIVVAKLFLRKRATPSFEIFGVKIALTHAWAIVLALTLAHAFVGLLFFRSVATVVLCGNLKAAGGAWKSLIDHADTRFILYSLKARTPLLSPLGPISLPRPNELLGDPIMWLHLAMVSAILPATITWKSASNRMRLFTTCLACSMVFANWWIGSTWALAASDLQRVSVNNPVVMRSEYESVLGHAKPECDLEASESK